jgi:hypothetical protein
MGKCAAKKMVRGYADGGEIDPEMQRKIDANKAKYNPQPKPTLFSGLFGSKPAQPQPQPSVQAQPGMIGAIQNRNEELKKAANYANGGKIEGPGTPTSDSIEAEVEDDDDGEENETIKVSTKERILSHEQDMLVEALAKKMGFKSLDAMLEAGTGKPVGPTMKGGMAAAATGAKPEDEGWGVGYGDKLTLDSIRNAIGVGGPSSGIIGNETIPHPSIGANYTAPAATEPSQFDAKWAAADTPVATPAASNPTSLVQAALHQQGPAQNAGLAQGLSTQVNAGVIRQGNSFTGTGPGIKEDMSNPLTSIDLNANNAGMAKANAIRQEMIDSQSAYRAEPGVSGGKIADSGRVEGDALLDKWGRQTDAKNAMQMAAANPRAAQAIASSYGANVQGETALARDATDQMRNESNNATLRRGQDTRLQETGMQNAVTERMNSAKIAGNPATNDLTKAQTGLAQAGLDDRKRQQNMIDEINNPATDPRRRDLLLQTIGKGPKFSAADGGTSIDPATGLALKNAPIIFDERTGQQVGAGKQAQAAMPKPQEVRGGYRFKGGDPSNKANWEKA